MNQERGELLLVVSAVEVAHELVRQLESSGVKARSLIATSAASAGRQAGRKPPAVILLDESAVTPPENLPMEVEKLARVSPVVVLADPRWQPAIAPLASRGEADFVARVGNFVPLVVSLLERRLRAEPAAQKDEGLPAGLAADFAEELRHEMNNPLTGILGNAELLLARKGQLAATDLRRLETIAELAVRLRETVRRLSHHWERREEVVRPV